MNHWLDLARDAALPLGVYAQALRRERRMGTPLVAQSVAAEQRLLRGWHYLIGDGRVLTLNVAGGEFMAADSPPSDAPRDMLQ